MWRPCSFSWIHSLTGPVDKPFASRLGDSGLHSGDAPTLTMEPGSSVNDVSLDWWSQSDPWSPAMIGPLCSRSRKEISHQLPKSCLPGSIPLLAGSSQHSDRVQSRSQVAGGEPYVGPATSLQYTVSLVCGSTVSFPPRGGSSLHPWDAPTLTMEPGSPVSGVSLHLLLLFCCLFDLLAIFNLLHTNII